MRPHRLVIVFGIGSFLWSYPAEGAASLDDTRRGKTGKIGRAHGNDYIQLSRSDDDDDDDYGDHSWTSDRDDKNPPDLSVNRDGTGKVKFSGGCTVHYDQGRRTEETKKCTADQLRRADNAVSDYRRDHGHHKSERHHEDDHSPPEIIMGKNGEGEVIFKNKCVVYYNTRGHRRKNLDACSNSQVQRADKAMKGYRKEQGM